MVYYSLLVLFLFLFFKFVGVIIIMIAIHKLQFKQSRFHHLNNCKTIHNKKKMYKNLQVKQLGKHQLNNSKIINNTEELLNNMIYKSVSLIHLFCQTVKIYYQHTKIKVRICNKYMRTQSNMVKHNILSQIRNLKMEMG